LSQTTLAAQLGTTRNAILHYERTAKNPSAEFVEKVAAFFGVGFDDLLGSATPTRKPGPTPQIAQLTERLSKLPRSEQKAAIKMLQGLFSDAG